MRDWRGRKRQESIPNSNSILILFTFYSYSIHSLFTFYSQSVHILFTFYSHSIEIRLIPMLFQFYSNSIPMLFQCYSIFIIFKLYLRCIGILFYFSRLWCVTIFRMHTHIAPQDSVQTHTTHTCVFCQVALHNTH